MNQFINRVIDILFSFIILVIFSPLLLIISIGIYFTSKGPVFFTSERIGKFGKPFKIYKFRSMSHDRKNKSKDTITIGADKRITKLGLFLRLTKLDEFPQFINIIRGEMSIIGPRPESELIVKNFYSINDKKQLFSIRPGLTSPGTLIFYAYHEKLEPICGLTKEEFYANYILPIKLNSDRHYINNKNLYYDFYLIFLTIIIIFKKVFSLRINWKPSFYSNPPNNWKDPRN